MRELHPELPTQGPHQYPLFATQLLEWMAAHQDLQVPPAGAQAATTADIRNLSVGTNINIVEVATRHSEPFVALDIHSPQHLIAAANNNSGSGRQSQFYSVNGGATWGRIELPLIDTDTHCDPALAWSTDGTAWSSVIGLRWDTPESAVQLFRSLDRGATWSYVVTLSDVPGNDKEMVWIDNHVTSPFKNNIYVAWDVAGKGVRFSRSADSGATWSPVVDLSNDVALGVHLTTGPAGELYVAWPDTDSRELRIRKSTNGGITFDRPQMIAKTNDAFKVFIPAMCRRGALIYLTLTTDRSQSWRHGWIYATWMDRNGRSDDPGCLGNTSESNSNIYFSRSNDGGATWSSPVVLHTDLARTDQFNPWMEVDQYDGTLYVSFYDTRDDLWRTETNLYTISSPDGGSTWVEETRVSEVSTDESTPEAGANQFGDYAGLAVYHGVGHPVWTDRRSGVPGNVEQIFTATVEREALPQDRPVGSPCTSGAQCQSGICGADGTCECSSILDCPPEQGCHDGRCRAAEKKECETCLIANVLDPGVCGPLDCRFLVCLKEKSKVLGDSCCRDVQCITGGCIGADVFNKTCQCQVSGDCPPPDEPCPHGYYCDLGLIGPAGVNSCFCAKKSCDFCTADKQCGTGKYCEGKPTGRCITGTENRNLGETCCRGDQCKSGSCTLDNGQCQCVVNSDCPSGQYCDLGIVGIGKNRCKPFKEDCAKCSADKECRPGALCVLGIGPGVLRCAANESRGKGESCCRGRQCASNFCRPSGTCSKPW